MVTETVDTQAVATAGSGLLSLMGIDTGRALKSFEDLVDGQSYAPAFNGVHQIGGRSGGALEMNKGVDEEIELPEGRRGFLGVYLGHRFNFTAWKMSMANDDDSDEMKARKEEFNGVAYGGTISPIFDGTNAHLLKDACSAYQFTRKAEKVKFDFMDSEAGHIRTTCEILMYYADADQAITISTPAAYDSVFGKEGTLAVLKALVDREAGGILPMPYKVTPITHMKTVNGYDVGNHHLAIDPVSDTKASQVYDSFKKYAEKLESPEGVEERAKIQSWLECTDRPASEVTLGYLQKAKNLGN